MKTADKVPPGAQGELGETREGLFERLQQLLLMHRDLLQALVILAKNKHQALIKADRDQLQKITAAENTLVLQARQVEDRRLVVTARLFRALGAPEDSPVSVLAALSPEPWRERLQDHTAALTALVGELKELNGRNTALLQNSLEFYAQFYAMLSGTATDLTPGYGPEEETKAAKGQQAFFNKRV
ncbi:MAG: flagellar protein FlgN [Heliobacteriaceae bacterium]|nr:flagellar protein FlgN [Heliobacteriaceae bacterium]